MTRELDSDLEQRCEVILQASRAPSPNVHPCSPLGALRASTRGCPWGHPPRYVDAMGFGAKKKPTRADVAREKAQAYRDEGWQLLLERLSYMSEAEAANYLAQRHLASSSKAGGFVVNAKGFMVHIDDVVRDSRHIKDVRELDENIACSSAERERSRADRVYRQEEEREQEEARERSRELRRRLLAEQGLAPEDEHLQDAPSTPAPVAPAPRQDSRAAWAAHVEREQAKQEETRALRAQEKEDRRVAQDAKRGAMQRARSQTALVLSRVLSQAMTSAAENGTDPAEQRLAGSEGP